MQRSINYFFVGAFIAVTMIGSSCTKNETLPAIDGYNSSEEVAKANLVAHWTFDDNNNEVISETAPSNTYGTVSSTQGPLGNALRLTEGALKYPSIEAIGGADSLSNFTVSMWVNVKNNGANLTTFFGIFPINTTGAWGNLSASAETGWFPNRGAGDTLVLRADCISQNLSGPDTLYNRPDPRGKPAIGVIMLSGLWTHFVMRWNSTTHLLQVFANGVSIGAYDNKGSAGPLIQGVPCHALIGSLATADVGFPNSADTWPKLANASVDDIRVFNSAITDKEITALYHLGFEGR